MMAAPPKLSPLLLSAISHADKATLQSVLKSMCESSNECTAAASQRLLVTRMYEAVELDDGDGVEDESEVESKGPARKKQKRETLVAAEVSRYETCATCHKRFDLTRNDEDACQLHDGDLEVDVDQFPDDDDIQAGEEIDVNSDWRVDEFPDGFIWTCCEENAKGPPCVVQKHVVMERT